MKYQIYSSLQKEFRALLEEKDLPLESALVSLIALLKERLSYASWVGFYRYENGKLWIGPYQGKLACLVIEPGKGVCGSSFLEQKTFIVPDVDAFPGHIACDALSRSEIVLPIWRSDELVGVLDLDSHQLAAFDEEDAKGIEACLKLLA